MGNLHFLSPQKRHIFARHDVLRFTVLHTYEVDAQAGIPTQGSLSPLQASFTDCSSCGIVKIIAV